MQKGVLKIFDPYQGALENVTTNFRVKIEFTCFSMGLTRNFYVKKGGPWNFLRSERGGAKNFCDKNCLHQAPLQVFVNGP